jgi:FkbM family methyltransferase
MNDGDSMQYETSALQEKTSYSLEGEDLILASLLRDVREGTYIDAGANHPTRVSNTFRLYQMGWSGLAIDGNEAFAPLWAAARPNDRFVHTLLSDSVKDAEFLVFPDDTMSSMDVDTSKRYAARFDTNAVTVRKMKTTTLATLQEQHLPAAEIHLLSVDVEGEDLNVLKGAALDRMRAGVVVVETKNCSLYRPLDNEIVSYMTGLGYRLVAKTMLDAFFVWPDKPYLGWIPRSLL